MSAGWGSINLFTSPIILYYFRHFFLNGLFLAPSNATLMWNYFQSPPTTQASPWLRQGRSLPATLECSTTSPHRTIAWTLTKLQTWKPHHQFCFVSRENAMKWYEQRDICKHFLLYDVQAYTKIIYPVALTVSSVFFLLTLSSYIIQRDNLTLIDKITMGYLVNNLLCYIGLIGR